MRVMQHHYKGCGYCYHCETGWQQLCIEGVKEVYGVTGNGAHAKYMSAKAAELACKNSIQAHGAMGYTWEMDLHIFMRKAWSLMACWGNEDKQQDIIYKTLTSSEEELGVLYTF